MELTFHRFLAFGVGLDPRQKQVFGPKLGPLLVGCTLGLVSFSSVGLAEGFPGVGMNPARCFAFAVARGEFRRKLLLHPQFILGGMKRTNLL